MKQQQKWWKPHLQLLSFPSFNAPGRWHRRRSRRRLSWEKCWARRRRRRERHWRRRCLGGFGPGLLYRNRALKPLKLAPPVPRAKKVPPVQRSAGSSSCSPDFFLYPILYMFPGTGSSITTDTRLYLSSTQVLVGWTLAVSTSHSVRFWARWLPWSNRWVERC